MKKLACKDVNPNTSCTFEASGNEAKEVVHKMFSHIKAEHMGDVKGMSDNQIRSMLEERVHE